MNTTFTENDLILFIYGEANLFLEAEIKIALSEDNDLRKRHESLLSTIKVLKSEKFEPHDTSLKITSFKMASDERCLNVSV